MFPKKQDIHYQMWNKLLKIALISVSVWEDEEVLEMDGGNGV